MKDVVSCDKLWQGAYGRYNHRFPNGETYINEVNVLRKEGKPGELKHLSNRRKRKQTSDFLSSGERKGNSPNQGVYSLGLRTTLILCQINRIIWKVKL